MPRLTAAALLVATFGCATAPEAQAPGSDSRTPATKTVGATQGVASPAGGAPGPASAGSGGAGKPAAAGSSSSFRPPFQMKELSEKEWLRALRAKLADRLKVPAEDLFFSPAKLTVGLLRTTERPVRARRRGPPPRRHYQIELVDHEGRQKAAFTPVSARGSDEPPKDLRFLAEDKLVYEVVSPPPPPEPPPPAKLRARPSARGHRRTPGRSRPRSTARRPVPERSSVLAAAEVGPPPRLFIIQPTKRRARPIRCEGTGFAFVKTPIEERMAFVSGRPQASFISVNGAQVYPRRGRAVIGSEPAWSKDGIALAFLERPAAAPARLILLAEFDNPSGDTTWPLPPTAPVDGARVFWAGPGRLVVGRSALKPIFATSFERERPRDFSP